MVTGSIDTTTVTTGVSTAPSIAAKNDVMSATTTAMSVAGGTVVTGEAAMKIMVTGMAAITSLR